MKEMSEALPSIGVNIDPPSQDREDLTESIGWLYRGIKSIVPGATGFANVCA